MPLTLTTVWADERLYYPLHAQPYTPASHFSRKQADPEFRTKLQIAADLIAKALAAGVTCRAVVADSFYGEHDDLRGALRQSGWVSSWPSSRRGAPGNTALRRTRRKTPPAPCPGAARTIPTADRHHRPATLPDKAAWYLATNLPLRRVHDGLRRSADRPGIPSHGRRQDPSSAE